MKTSTFYRWSLLSPILVPLCLLPLANNDSTVISNTARTLGVSLVFGGIPYLLTLLLFINVLIRGTDKELQWLAWLLPLPMALVQIVCMAIWAIFSNHPLTGEELKKQIVEGGGFGILLSGFVLSIGYTYVVVTHLLLWLLRWAKMVAPTEELLLVGECRKDEFRQ